MDAPRDVILFSARREMEEIEELVRSLGYRIIDRVTQIRSRPDPNTFLGTGKLKQVAQRLLPPPSKGPPLSSGGRLLGVVDASLKPPQLFGIEDILRIEVWDRIRVILEIFAQKAQVKEARLQVELAKLRYELPFVHEALHRTLTGEHPGFMGGGELEARTYETHLKRRTKRILEELSNVKKERVNRREGRRKSGFHLIAIAGYTNSGKSSLLNALCGSDTYVENLYFSTLQTTTRRLKAEWLEGHKASLLFTDTVGFIRDLPPWLVDAFASTLEEVADSDVILLVVDAAEAVETIRFKLETATSLLDQLHASKRRIVLLNKGDLILPQSRLDIQNTLSLSTYYPTNQFIWMSTQTTEGLRELINRLLNQFLPSRTLRIRLDPLRPGHLSLESWLLKHTDVISRSDKSKAHELVVRCSDERYPQLRRRGSSVEAALEELPSIGN